MTETACTCNTVIEEIACTICIMYMYNVHVCTCTETVCTICIMYMYMYVQKLCVLYV